MLVAALLAATLASCDGEQLTDAVGPVPGGPTTPIGPADVAVVIDVMAPERIELTDSVSIRVVAWDPNAAAGITRLGFAAVITDTQTGVNRARTAEQTLNAVPGDTVYSTFSVHPDWLAAENLPSEFVMEVHGWAVNSVSRCSAAVPEDDSTNFACVTAVVDNTTLTLADVGTQEIPVMAVVGRTTPFPTSTIVVGDLQVDTFRSRAYLSNRLSNHLHVFHPTNFDWEGDVTVGSEPWGLHLNTSGDTLLVANSGGTSVSRVSLAGDPQEAVTSRIQTRNTALFEVEYDIETDTLPDSSIVADTLTKGVRFLDFSDRPQYVSQDAAGRVLYSTRPTGVAPRGTVRVVTNQLGWDEHYTRMLARIPLDVTFKDKFIAILNADSVRAFVGGLLEVWDHPQGFPSQPFSSGIQLPLDALRTIGANPLSDVESLVDSEWILDAVSFADTTYV